ncbi:hypothetical protein FOMA001_g11848 [Fusarium oxysporum f. sp. matthiolae]|nr:hypothetical protein FOMA001_g11848 [Fusarium oxysporum f. sp. matthiolae]
MHRRFKAWMDSKRHSRQRIPRDPEMPCLPNPRLYALTPSPSQEQITKLAETVPFFRLPLELRRKILIHAFGNRTVHIDLVLTHPLRKPLNVDTSHRSIDPKYRFCGGGRGAEHLYPYTQQNLGLDTSQPKCWQWRGCVCHRLLPPEYKITVKFPHYAKPGDDRCCDGWGTHCRVWTRKHGRSDSCWIGVMGWLLTCHQAYAEGIEILYGTNIIHISSKPLLTNLSTLVLPQRLSIMTSLEIVFSLDNHERQSKAVPNQQELDNGLLILDTHFPHLLSLHLGLRLNLPIVEETEWEIKRKPAYLQGILQSVDAFVKRRSDLPHLDHFQDAFLLSMSESAYKDFKTDVQNDSRHHFKFGGVQVWRHLASEPLVLDDEGEIANATVDNGYWIWGDFEDRYEMDNRPVTMVSCFASMEQLVQSKQPTLFFQMLPPEIRRRILIEAFGDQTVHMDLTYDHPPAQGDKDKLAHALIQVWGSGMDKSRPKCWYWRRCTCHRVPPPWDCSWARGYSMTAVANDECCVGLAHCCRMWTNNGKKLYWCWIGAMGWLLTCRQAYAEGIDVLYSTNTIHISSATLLADLPAYIVPQRLSAITSLEIIWLVDSDYRSGKNVARENDLNTILLILDNHFPSLKRLNLALKLGLPKDAPAQLEHLFEILDGFFIRHLSDRMREPFAVSISYVAYKGFEREIVRAQGYKGQVFHWQIWRFFGGEYALPQVPWSGDYFDTTPGARFNNGYWIYPGEVNDPRWKEREQDSRA